MVCVPLSNDEPGLFEIQATLRLYAESILQVLFVLCWLRYRKRPGRSAKQSGETIAAFETFLSGKQSKGPRKIAAWHNGEQTVTAPSLPDLGIEKIHGMEKLSWKPCGGVPDGVECSGMLHSRTLLCNTSQLTFRPVGPLYFGAFNQWPEPRGCLRTGDLHACFSSL